MANYFVDDTTGDSGDSGTTMDYAWPSIKYAVEQASKLTASDIVWVRRGHDEWNGDTATADITPDNTQDGTRKNPIQVIGWPRNTYSVTSASWNNGSTIVNGISPTLTRKSQCGRFVTAPNGKQYLITIIDAGDSLRIDREYSGGDTSGTGGASTIKADEDYDLAQTIGDTGWTIQKSNWNGDTHDLAMIDFGGGAFQINHTSATYWNYKNLDLRSSSDANGIIAAANGLETLLQGCLVYQNENVEGVLIRWGGQFFIKRCIFEGNQTGTAQVLIVSGAYAKLYIYDSAIYGAGDHGLTISANDTYLRNVNIGIEKTNGDDDIRIGNGGTTYGFDVRLGGNVKEVDYVYGYQTLNGPRAHIENYQKVLGAHKTFVLDDSSYYEKKDVVLNSGDPEKRTDGADSIIKLVFSANAIYDESQKYLASEIFCHEFYGDTTSKSYRYYVQLDAIASLTTDQLWIEAEYVDSYSDSTAYTVTQKVSDEATTLRGDTSDWDEYVEVTNVQPAVAGTVRIKCYAQFYDANGKLYIDPQVFIY